MCARLGKGVFLRIAPACPCFNSRFPVAQLCSRRSCEFTLKTHGGPSHSVAHREQDFVHLSSPSVRGKHNEGCPFHFGSGR
jgi:hypothetical protein